MSKDLYFEKLTAMHSANKENALDSLFLSSTHDLPNFPSSSGSLLFSQDWDEWSNYFGELPTFDDSTLSQQNLELLQDAHLSGISRKYIPRFDPFEPDNMPPVVSVTAEKDYAPSRAGSKRPKLRSLCAVAPSKKKKKRKGVSGIKGTKTIATEFVQKRNKQQKVAEYVGDSQFPNWEIETERCKIMAEKLESGTLVDSPILEVVISPVIESKGNLASTIGNSIFACEHGVGAPEFTECWKFAHVHSYENSLEDGLSLTAKDLHGSFALEGCMSISPEVEDEKIRIKTEMYCSITADLEDGMCCSPTPEDFEQMDIVWPKSLEAPALKAEPMDFAPVVKDHLQVPFGLDADEAWTEPESIESISVSDDARCETKKRKRSHQPKRKRRRKSKRTRRNSMEWWNQFSTSVQNGLIQSVDDCVNEHCDKYENEEELSHFVKQEIREMHALSEQQADDLEKIYLDRKREKTPIRDPRAKRGKSTKQFDNGPDFYTCVRPTRNHRIGEKVRFRSVFATDETEEQWEGVLWEENEPVIVKKILMQHGEKVEIVNYERLKVDAKHWKSVDDVVVTYSQDLESATLFTLPQGKTVKFGNASCDGMLDRRQIGGYVSVQKNSFVKRRIEITGQRSWVCNEDTLVHDKLDSKKAKLLFTIPAGTPVTFDDESDQASRRKVICGWVTVADVENNTLNFVYQDIHSTALVPESIRLDCPKYELPDELTMLTEAMKRNEKKRWFFVDGQAFLLQYLADDHSSLSGKFYHPDGYIQTSMELPTGKIWCPLIKHLTHRRRAQEDVKIHMNMTQSSKTVKYKKQMIPLTTESIEEVFDQKLAVIEDIRKNTTYEGDHIVLNKVADSLNHCRYLALNNKTADGHFDLSNRVDIHPTLTPADVPENMNWLLHTADLIERIQSRCGEVVKNWKKGLIQEWKNRESLETRKSSRLGVDRKEKSSNTKRRRKKGSKKSNKK